MKNKNLYLLLAGGLNLFTSFVHLIGGQLDLVNPLMHSSLTSQAKTEWLGVWHLITVVLFLTSFYLLRLGLGKANKNNCETLGLIALLYVLFGAVFIIVSLWMKTFAPQWILLMPIGALVYAGAKKI